MSLIIVQLSGGANGRGLQRDFEHFSKLRRENSVIRGSFVLAKLAVASR